MRRRVNLFLSIFGKMVFLWRRVTLIEGWMWRGGQNFSFISDFFCSSYVSLLLLFLPMWQCAILAYIMSFLSAYKLSLPSLAASIVSNVSSVSTFFFYHFIVAAHRSVVSRYYSSPICTGLLQLANVSRCVTLESPGEKNCRPVKATF